jgi:hypothetical protein
MQNLLVSSAATRAGLSATSVTTCRTSVSDGEARNHPTSFGGIGEVHTLIMTVGLASDMFPNFCLWDLTDEPHAPPSPATTSSRRRESGGRWNPKQKAPRERGVKGRRR